jgi:hypothetical protein
MLGYRKSLWYLGVVGLVVLFIVNYFELSDWRQAIIPVLSVLALVSLLVGFASLLLTFKQRATAEAFIGSAVGLASLAMLWLLGVTLSRLLIFVALSFFASLVFVLANWVKGRAAR